MKTKILMVCDALPLAGKTGHQSYLRDLADYAIDRKCDLTIIVLSNRLEFLLATHKNLNFPPSVRLIGPPLRQFGPFIVYVSPATWLRPPYLMLRRWLDRAAALAAGKRGALPRQTARIGRFIGGPDLAFVRRTLAELKPDMVLIDTIFRAPAVTGAWRTGNTVLISHDIFHQKCDSLLKVFTRVVPHVTREMEAEIARDFDHILAVTPEDQATFQDMAPDSHTIICASPVRYRGTARRGGQQRLVFVGSGANHNVDGLNWFLTAVWPLVRQAVPAAQIDVVGTICRHIAAGPGINRLDIVNDLAPVLSQAACAINPLRAGSGLKIKMLDYLSFGAPVVTTSVGAQGFVQNGAEPFVICDEAADFAARTIEFLTDSAFAQAMSARCEAYATLFSQEDAYRKLDGIVAAIQAADPSGASPGLASAAS